LSPQLLLARAYAKPYFYLLSGGGVLLVSEEGGETCQQQNFFEKNFIKVFDNKKNSCIFVPERN
ncbi:MAG: hypothetical protein IK000_03345, partial [Bacteroidaceae bacterium]|nr:hypothetical protein [Bacteroidaceae bacterium]